MHIENHEHVSLSGETRAIDERMETSTVGGKFDTTSPREYVCLCTRCREVRHIPKNLKGEKDDAKKTLPFITVRRYRSSVGEELFISFEDALGYLYGFTRLLLPDVGNTVSWDGLGKGTALIREVHVYGSLASLFKENAGNVQHTGIGTQLMNLAEQIA